MGTEPLFWGIRVAVIDPFFITCDNFPDKSINYGITDKLTTDIHSTLNQLRCQFMRCRSTTSVWFSKCLNLEVYDIFWCTKFSDSLWVHFCEFSSKTLSIFSISHNFGLPEHGKSLVFSSTVLKHWNHHL